MTTTLKPSVIHRIAAILGVFCTLLSITFHTLAATTDPEQQTIAEAFNLVERTAERTIQLALGAKHYYENEPERYYQQIGSALGEVTNFEALSLGIMNSALQKSRNDDMYASASQIEQFTTLIHEAIAKAYGNALFFFCCKRTEVRYPKYAKQGAKEINVTQYVFGGPSEPNIIIYNLHRNESGVWKVHNFNIQGVNIGKEYKRKFDRLYRQYNRDIASLIEHWSKE